MEILLERKFPVGELALLASPVLKESEFSSTAICANQRLDSFDFNNTENLPPVDRSLRSSRQRRRLKAVSWWNTSHFRNDDDIPGE